MILAYAILLLIASASSSGLDEPAHTRSLVRAVAFRTHKIMLVELDTDRTHYI